MAERFEFTLGSVEASVVGQALGVDIRRFPLRIRNSTVDPVRFANVAIQVYRRLENVRLSVAGELHPSVRTAFELLGNHRVSVTVNGIDGLGGDIAALTVTDGAQALEIGQAPGEDLLQFALFPDEALVEVLAGVLPQARAATTGAHTVEQRAQQQVSAMTARRRAEVEADEEETDAFGNIELMGVVRARQTVAENDHSDIGVLERVMAGKRLGGGHIIATGRGRRDEFLTTPPLSWLDTEDGRYLIHTETRQPGTMTAHYVPAGPADVVKAVRQIIASVY
jgi:hypothetical protein